MRATPVLSLTLVGAALLAASASCSGPGAGKETFSSDNVQQNGTKKSGDDDDTSTTPAGTSSGSAATDKVFGTTTFGFDPPKENADDHAATHTGKTPLAGKNCVDTGCHLTTQPWGFAGTVFADAKGASGAGIQAEIGVVYADGKIRSAMTDAQGNFWLPSVTDPPTGVKAIGIRKAGSATKYMATALPAGDAGRACSSAPPCHGFAAGVTTGAPGNPIIP